MTLPEGHALRFHYDPRPAWQVPARLPAKRPPRPATVGTILRLTRGAGAESIDFRAKLGYTGVAVG